MICTPVFLILWVIFSHSWWCSKSFIVLALNILILFQFWVNFCLWCKLGIQLSVWISNCPTLSDPLYYTVHGILQARILEWVAFPFSRGSSQPSNQPGVSSTAGRSFASWAIRECQCGTHCHGKNARLSSPWARGAFPCSGPSNALQWRCMVFSVPLLLLTLVPKHFILFGSVYCEWDCFLNFISDCFLIVYTIDFDDWSCILQCC